MYLERYIIKENKNINTMDIGIDVQSNLFKSAESLDKLDTEIKAYFVENKDVLDKFWNGDVQNVISDIIDYSLK